MSFKRVLNFLGSTLDRSFLIAWLASVALFAVPVQSSAQTSSAPHEAVKPPAAEQGVRWGELKPAEQSILQPLQSDWATIDSPRKQKWLELAARFPTMSPTEQSRVQARMVEWTKLTPQERGQARVNFQEAKQLPAQDRQSRWDAYQKLPDEQKRELAARAAPPALRASGQVSPKEVPAATPGRADKPSRDLPQPKSNLVPNPAISAAPKPVSPTIVQAGPGATTTMMTKRANPPPHQQAGLPKIAATPEFVDKATLLPQRGPQGAATRSASAAHPSPPKQP
jgi:hypothetical protein